MICTTTAYAPITRTRILPIYKEMMDIKRNLRLKPLSTLYNQIVRWSTQDEGPHKHEYLTSTRK